MCTLCKLDLPCLSGHEQEQLQMEYSPAEERARMFLETLWLNVCEEYFKRIVAVTEMTPEMEQAVRNIVLRPNDFRVVSGVGEEEVAN